MQIFLNQTTLILFLLPSREQPRQGLQKNIAKNITQNGSQVWEWLAPIDKFSLWAYRTTICTPAKATPFSLVYGSEAILPLEVEILSLYVSLHELITDEDHRAIWLHELETLDEHHKPTFVYMRDYQKHMSTQYNKKVHTCEFQVGELVPR